VFTFLKRASNIPVIQNWLNPSLARIGDDIAKGSYLSGGKKMRFSCNTACLKRQETV